MNDVFRKEYKPLTEEQKAWMSQVKGTAEMLYDILNNPRPQGFSGEREIALAKTNLEQAMMWAVKGITG